MFPIAQCRLTDTSAAASSFGYTKGMLKHDAGTVTLSAAVGGNAVRNGSTATLVTATTTAKSKLGSFRLSQRIDSVDVGGGYASDRVTWTLSAGTGAYKGLSGKGVTASIAFPGAGQINIRREGTVSR